MDQDDGDPMAVRDALQGGDVLVVAGIQAIGVRGLAGPDFLQRVANDELHIRMLPEVLFQVRFQATLDRVCCHGEIEVRRRCFRQLKEPPLQPDVCVLQGEVEDAAPVSGEVPEREPLGDLKAKPEHEPALTGFACSAEQTHALGDEAVHHKERRSQGHGGQVFRADDFNGTHIIHLVISQIHR